MSVDEYMSVHEWPVEQQFEIILVGQVYNFILDAYCRAYGIRLSRWDVESAAESLQSQLGGGGGACGGTDIFSSPKMFTSLRMPRTACRLIPPTAAEKMALSLLLRKRHADANTPP